MTDEQFDILKYATIIQMPREIHPIPVGDGSGRLVELRARETDIQSLWVTGTGVMEPLGILSFFDTHLVERWDSGAICFSDLYDMFETLHIKRGQWIFSPTAYVILREMLDAGGQPIFDKRRGKLLGLWVHEYIHSPCLGETGDVVLADLSSYIVGQYDDGDGKLLLDGMPINGIIQTNTGPAPRFVALGQSAG